MAAPECEREARKRRERRDSGCAHERKERRPHSEERAPPACPPPQPPPALHDYNRLEVERRAERLSRARRPQYGGKRRRAAPRAPRIPKENERTPTTDDNIICCSPPPFDINLLYKQLYRDEGSETPAPEPAPHRAQFDEEPARSVAAQRPPPPPPMHRPRPPSPPPAALDQRSLSDKRLDKINKKISVSKKNIAKYENDFERQNGFAMTQSDRMTDLQWTRMYENLVRLQSEKRCLKTDPVEYELKVQAGKQQKERDDMLDLALNSDKSMSDLVLDIEQWLEGTRTAAGRSTATESIWNAAQLASEKACVQRALLRLEAARGRPPAHSAERGAARHLYERYRAVKRALAAVRPDAVLCNGAGELATIHEHEAMLFTSVDSSSEERDQQNQTDQESVESESPSATMGAAGAAWAAGEEGPSSTSSARSTCSDEPTAGAASPANEGLHCLNTEELTKVLVEAKLQKSVLRRTIKEYEVSFEAQNSRKVQRDDKIGHEDEYSRYKAVKARIKLLNALLNKQKALT